MPDIQQRVVLNMSERLKPQRTLRQMCCSVRHQGGKETALAVKALTMPGQVWACNQSRLLQMLKVTRVGM